mmetsp:Transcript_9777/g.26143  ORF Transcript_9777/g.26143 Transcript_9777/m.26143 type:complete len:438 (-) Transcript_9777:108-1421(-)
MDGNREKELLERLRELEKENAELKRRLAERLPAPTQLDHVEKKEMTAELSHDEVKRYSRQLLVPSFGPSAQRKLKATSFLIIGAGGLGCPALQYLVASGAGRIGIVDHDTVDVSNLHRQVLHDEALAGQPKVISAKAAALRMRSNAQIDAMYCGFDRSVALDIVDKYDIVLDATDNVATRYLINDACVLKKKPLVSASAVKMEGQLTVYNYRGGPCYRCLFPDPPPAATVTNCADGGVLGVIPGILGTLQALEAIKVATDAPSVLTGKLLIFDGEDTLFRSLKLRTKRGDCDVCGERPSIEAHCLPEYEKVCGPAHDKPTQLLLEGVREATCSEVNAWMQNRQKVFLIDVREVPQFEICSIEGSVPVPMRKFKRALSSLADEIRSASPDQVVCLCRRGNDSKLAAVQLEEALSRPVYSMKGGLQKWASDIDPSMPTY